MKCLVTGSRGFIGQHLVKSLLDDDKVTTLVGVGRTEGDKLEKLPLAIKSRYSEFNLDVTSPIDVASVMAVFQPDVIFHLAGIAVTQPDPLFPTKVITTNVVGTQLLLHYAPTGCRFVFGSSATVYGDCTYPKSEDDALSPTSEYGASKVACEALVNAYTKQGKVSGVSLRYVANVGKGATHGALPAIIAKLRANSQFLELIGECPGSVKPYMHVQDTVEITKHFGLYSPFYTHPINVGPCDNLSIHDMAYIAMRATEIFKDITWSKDKVWAGDNKFVSVCNSHLVRVLLKKVKSSNEAVRIAAREL